MSSSAERGTGPELALHLRASAGDPLDASADWSRVNGNFHRISFDRAAEVAHIARTGEPVRIDRLSEDARWVRFPEWVERERLVGFAGRPLIFRGEVVGVLGAFRRVELNDDCWSVAADAVRCRSSRRGQRARVRRGRSPSARA